MRKRTRENLAFLAASAALLCAPEIIERILHLFGA